MNLDRVPQKGLNRFLLVSPGGLGGIQLSCCRLAQGLQNAGYQPHVLYEESESHKGNRPEPPSGVAVSVFKESTYGNYYHAIKRMAAFIKKERFQYVHLNTSSTAYRAIALLGSRRPVAIGGCRGDNPHDYACNAEFVDYLDHTFAVSSRCLEGLRRRLVGHQVGISVIHNSTDLVPRLTDKPRSGKLQIVYAGRLVVGKRIEDAIRIVKLLRDSNVDLKFIIAGEGPQRIALERLVESYQIGQDVCFLGNLSRIEVGELMDRAHLNLLLSESEGFGLSVVDGMSRGVVPIVSEACGCKEIISNGEDGFIVKLGDTNGIVNLVRELASQRERLAELSRKSYFTFVQRLTPDKELDAHLEVIRLAQEHHLRWADRAVGWKYDGKGLLDQRWVPDWVSRSVRLVKHRYVFGGFGQ